MEQSKKEIQNLKQPADKQNVSNSDTAVSKKNTVMPVIGNACGFVFKKADWKVFSHTRFWNCCYSMLCRE